jgi:hypothetical protein
MALIHRAACQGVVHTFIQTANSAAAVSRLVDFEAGAEKKLGGKLFHREADGIGGVSKPLVADRLPPGFTMATGKQFGRGIIIKSGYRFDSRRFARDSFDDDFSNHDYVKSSLRRLLYPAAQDASRSAPVS